MTLEFELDYETVRHLDAWIAREICPVSFADNENVRNAMLAIAASDPDYWLNLGWWAVYGQANCPGAH